MRKSVIAAVFQLARAGNALLAGWATVVGGITGASDFSTLLALKGAIAAALVAAWGNAVNDICDRRSDAAAKPERPLPAGRLSLRAALVWASLFALGALFLSIFINRSVFIAVVLTIFLLWLYSYRLKGWPGVGHGVVALVSGFTFVFGALVQGEALGSILPQAWFAFGLATIWHLARELVKAAEDAEQDRMAGKMTLAVSLGPPLACRLASLLLGILVLGLWPPYVAGYFNRLYLLLVAAGVAPLLLATAVYLWHVPDRTRLEQISTLLKWDMVVGVCAIWFGLR